MAPLWAKQPFRALYNVCFLFVTPPYLFLLFVRYLFKSLRPLPEWSLKVCLNNAMIRLYFHKVTATRDQLKPILDPAEAGEAKERFALVEPPPAEVFSGVLDSDTVKPAPVSGIWFPRPIVRGDEGVEKEKVIIHFPGGAFVMTFPPDSTGKLISDGMLKTMGATKLFFAQYRLARDERSRFPAALQDAVSFYKYVLEQGVDPANIILSGDSAGGNIAIALMRYLETSQSELPPVGGVMAYSPWVHVPADSGRSYNDSPNAQCDLLISSLLQWGADAYRPDGKLDSLVESFISPLHHPFRTNTPLFLQAGTCEAFHDAIQNFATEMSELNGNDHVKFHATTLGSHDLVLTYRSSGMTSQFQTAVQEARELIDQKR